MSSTPARTIALSLVLLSAGLAGCIGSDDTPTVEDGNGTAAVNGTVDAGPRYASFEEAMAAPGDVFEPEEDAPQRLKLLSPADPRNVSVDKHDVVILLFDPSQDGNESAIADANATLDAIMPAMGHGTSPEEDPVHDAHGVYAGMTNLMMDGRWILEFEATLPEGSTLTWSISVLVGDAAGQADPNAEPVHHRYETSFEDDVTDADYNQTWTFPVNATGAKVFANLTLAEESPLDELSFRLLDADGGELATATLGPERTTAALSAGNAPNDGTYTLAVDGRAVETSYTADVTVTWITMEPATDESGDHDDGHDHEH